MTMPNFLIIGTGKSGTTSLYYYLRQHKQVYMAPIKEPTFFALGGQDLETCSDVASRRNRVNTLSAYQALFDRVSGELAIGEASTAYLPSPQAPERIKHYIPKARLIAILRNPVDRAFSAYLMNARDGVEPYVDLEQELRDGHHNGQRRPFWDQDYIESGLYYMQVQRYFRLFDPKQIKIFLYEEWMFDSLRIFRQTLEFLGVDETIVPDMSLKHNVSGLPKYKSVHRLVIRTSPTGKLIRRVLPPRILATLRSLYYQNFLERPELPLRAREELLMFYREDVLKLQTLIQRDLSNWLS